MRQAVEAQVLNPHCELGEHGLRQILGDVIQEVRRSVNQDIDGAEILHSLLNASWMQSLLKVYECLQRYRRDSPAPALDYASGLSLQLLIDIRALPGCSEDAKELCSLLRQPQLQALLSAHDTVAQKDYEPVLPPMPDNLPDDEEATRTVCLVKNKQPLLRDHQRVGLLRSSSPGAQSSRGGLRSHWDTLRHLTQQRLHHRGPGPAAGRLDSLWRSVRRGSYPPSEPPCNPPPRYEPTSNRRKPASRCRVCYADLLWERSPTRSAPSVYSSVMIDDIVEELDSGDEEHAGGSAPAARRWTMSPPCLAVPYYSSDYLRPGLPPGRRSQSPRVRTAPPSPMRPRRAAALPPVELAKQESLDELRTTVQLAACSMESSTKDIKLLGEKMAAATERMSETVQDNSQALALLTQVVDRLQTLLVANAPRPAERDGAPKPPQRPSLTHQSGCSFPSLPSSSSSSLSSLHDATSTSQGTSCLSASCQASPQTAPKTRSAPSPQKKRAELQASERLVTNGRLDEAKEAPHAGKGGRSKQQRRKRRKKAT